MIGFKKTAALRQNLKLSMKMWLPLLECGSGDFEKYIEKIAEQNPCFEIKKSKSYTKESTQEIIEKTAATKESLYEKLMGQIEPPMFPTSSSQEIAKEIVENINSEGFFEGDIELMAQEFDEPAHKIESIRGRFCYLEPPGVGAVDIKESFLFQLMQFELEDSIYWLLKEMILNLENISIFKDKKGFKEAQNILKRLKNPPAIDFLEEQKQIIPEFFLEMGLKGDIKITPNSRYYPDIVVSNPKAKELKTSKKEATDLKKLIALRKETLTKIVTLIAKKQYNFFKGEQLAPLKITDAAYELNLNQSTLSRAISSKYIGCDRGVFDLRSFFGYGFEGISQNEIKNFIKDIIGEEDRDRPFSDEKLQEIINRNFDINLSRRAVSKYRLSINIPSSRERKKLNISSNL